MDKWEAQSHPVGRGVRKTPYLYATVTPIEFFLQMVSTQIHRIPSEILKSFEGI